MLFDWLKSTEFGWKISITLTGGKMVDLLKLMLTKWCSDGRRGPLDTRMLFLAGYMTFMLCDLCELCAFLNVFFTSI